MGLAPETSRAEHVEQGIDQILGDGNNRRLQRSGQDGQLCGLGTYTLGVAAGTSSTVEDLHRPRSCWTAPADSARLLFRTSTSCRRRYARSEGVYNGVAYGTSSPQKSLLGLLYSRFVR